MRGWGVVLLALGSCGAPGAGRGGVSEPLSIGRMLDGPPIAGVSPALPAWSPGGDVLAFLWNESGEGAREVWLVDADGTGLRRLVERGGDVFDARRALWLPSGEELIVQRGDDLWRVGVGGEAAPVVRDLGAISSLQLSPDGRFASFLRGGDLWLQSVEGGGPVRVTFVGVPPLSALPIGRYNRPDVEIGPYIWGGPTYAWAPDGRTIAVHHVDRRGLAAVPFPDYLGDETSPNLVRRSYPGAPNEKRRVGLLNVESLQLSMLDLAGPEDNRVIDFAWSPDGKLLIDRESDTAVDRWLHVLDPATGTLDEIWHDTRETRVYTLGGSAWHPDGEHVVMLGDLADRYGLYRVGGGIAEPERLTSPDFDVTAVPQVAGGAIVFQSNEPSPEERHVFHIAPGGGTPLRLTGRPGESRAYPSPDGRHVAILHSDDNTPTELYIVDAEQAAKETRVTHSTHADFDERAWPDVRYVTFPSRADGSMIHARIMEPPGLDRGKRHPVLFGPVYSNTVRNRWGGRYRLIQQLLIERGYIVVQVDVRGSTGYGRAFREAFLGDFAGIDLEDLESAVEFMEAQPHVDPDRIGVWGSSYGGTLTVYALLKKPGLFQAGVAGAAAVDPHFFGSDDVAIVRRPDSLPEAFTRGAAQYAANLEDDLLIIHGMQDQVVPFRTTVALAEALMAAGKDFDFAFAPRATHGWTGSSRYARYLLGKMLTHFERALAPQR